ncbi:MAG TPA: alpha/beta hydrolase [Cellvibrionaceae bacterium]
MYKFSLILLAFFTLPTLAAEPTAFSKHDNITCAQPAGFKLTTDIYVPTTGKDSYPVVVIIHGGGWLINDNSIMNDMSEYLAAEGEFVVANMNYRLLGDNNNTTTLNQIVEDVMGGVLWVKEHIGNYKGDPERMAITGDSAGGHLSAMTILARRNLASEGFADGKLAFTPSYLPAGKTVEKIAKEDGLRLQAAVISYGAFDMHAAAEGGFESPDNFFWQMGGAEARGLFGKNIDVKDHPEYYRAVSPIFLIPAAEDDTLPPQFVHVGSLDQTTPPTAVKAYADALKEAGQPVNYTLYPELKHAFLDSGCSDYFGSCFTSHAVPVLDDIIAFLNQQLRAH